MEQFMERLLDEQSQLDVRVDKLREFLSSPKGMNIDKDQLFLLNAQLSVMVSYKLILDQRINLLL